jgi:hypothetical protein
MLRALRQHPPSLAATDEGRRATFSAALEQSEQFFSAAAAAGPQTRGLLLFYGVSQAGRALRAAQQPDADWARAGSHGIKVVGESTSGSFADARVRDTRNKPSDAFGWVATTLNRASLPRNTRVGDLARLLFPGGHFPLAGDDPTYPVLELAAVRDAGLSMGRDTAVGGLRANLRVPASTASSSNRSAKSSSRSSTPSKGNSTSNSTEAAPPPASWSASHKRMRVMTTAIWHNDQTGQPVRRSLLAHDH